MLLKPSAVTTVCRALAGEADADAGADMAAVATSELAASTAGRKRDEFVSMTIPR
ncbi:hypothetical protein Airi02_094450 [Actinoallomurus iriomotensis]|uniref:Uncharacterized protein n=1 Tax=Actinoallomurus iriomotensis TaxID=478107 RepID=A0A9W6SEV2_9ACTN|nr:hypothetical protein Airi02_094450 [Actinoallomurus iriomotensis]